MAWLFRSTTIILIYLLPFVDGIDITRYWGNISPYHTADGFGVTYNEIPSDCTVSQVHILHRHGERFPGSATNDGTNTRRFAGKVEAASANGMLAATGPLAFLNTYQYRLGVYTLTARGAKTLFYSGAQFWRRYGRILYNEMRDSRQWDDSLNIFPDGTPRPKPLLRASDEALIYASARWWAAGFFANSNGVPTETSYHLLVIPSGRRNNNTLVPEESCSNNPHAMPPVSGSTAQTVFYHNYLRSAVARLSDYVDPSFDLTPADVYAMQTICVYEVESFGSSDFCDLFTVQEWIDFDYSLSIDSYADSSFSNPRGRALGIGYVQELLARLQQQYIYVSHTSVNSTLDNNPTTFPLRQPFYLDVTHETLIVSVLTALGLDYFRGPRDGLPYNISHAPYPSENFRVSQIAPFGARLYTEVLTCSSSNPEPNRSTKTTFSSYPEISRGWKFVRMQLNGKTLPLDTLGCPYRPDGLCSLENFLATQMHSTAKAHYTHVCFGSDVSDTAKVS